MNRRRRQPSRKLLFEVLEPRQLLSLASDRSLVAAAARHAQTKAEAELSNVARADLDVNVFATQLVHHPLMAERKGLSALAAMMDQHAGYAARHGWGATLDLVLTQHPAYAARHDLTALMASPATSSPGATSSTVTTLATPTAAATDPAFTTTTSSPAVTSSVSSASAGGSTVAPPITTPSSPSPVSVAAQSFSIAVGGVLDVTIQPGNLSGTGVTETITPQPLPANMTFNRETGALAFAAAPGQAGTYRFTITATNGIKTFVEPVNITVTQPQIATTEVSGRVVDESGKPLAGMPVSIGGSTTTTNAQGVFTLAGIGANPGPLSAGGSVATADGRLALSAPVDQLLGHMPYAGATNVIPAPLIVPKVDWSVPSSFVRPVATQPLTATDSAFPGFAIQLAAGGAGRTAATGTVQVAELSAAESAQHMPVGMSSPMLLYKTVGLDLTQPAQLSLPNISGYGPGSVVSLLKFNPLTGGHDAVARMVVSADGKSMTSTSPVTLASAPKAAAGSSPTLGQNDTGGGSLGGGSGRQGNAAGVSPGIRPDFSGSSSGSSPTGTGGGTGTGTGGGGYTFSACLLEEPGPTNDTPDSPCPLCDLLGGLFGALDSNAGLVNGEYLQDHQTVTYQSQGQARGIDLQYSSAQVDPEPIAQYQFTTPVAGESSSITSITAQLTVAGVVQGDPTTYDIPDGGLSDGTTYTIPLQGDASALYTGVYPYTMTVTEHFGSTSITTTNEGNLNVVNPGIDPYSNYLGVGWSVGGLQRLSPVVAGFPVLITTGQEPSERFDPVYDNGQTYFQDLALAASTSTSQILANDGAGGFTAAGSTSDDGVVGTATGDFNGDGRVDQAVVDSSTLAILINNGSGGFTVGSSYTLPAGEEAKAVAVGNFTDQPDGILDIAVLLAPSDLSGDYSIALYAGTGEGTFASPAVSSAGNGVSSGSNPDTMTVADLNGDGVDDLAFTTDDGLVDVMFCASVGDFSRFTTLSMPSGHLAIGITAADNNDDGAPDLIVQALNTNVEEFGSVPFVSVDLIENNGYGGFSYESTYLTVGQQDMETLGIVAGDFNGPDAGLEVAVPISGGGENVSYLDVVPLAADGTWGNGVVQTIGDYDTSAQPGNIVAADLNGAGKPSIALTNGDTGQIWVLLADPDSNQLLPVQQVSVASAGTSIGMLAVAPFDDQAATAGFRGPSNDPSTLVENWDDTWTRTYPDGTVIQFNTAGWETSEDDRNNNDTSYTYYTTDAAFGALHTITDPVGLVTTLTYATYGDFGTLWTISDPGGRATYVTVDPNDNLIAINDPDYGVTQYGYSTPSNHVITSETDPNGNTATPSYNSFGQFTGETLFDGTSNTAVSAAENQGLYAPGGEGALPIVTDGVINQATVTDPDGNTTTISYNALSHPAGVTDPASGGTTTTTYTQQGFPATVTDLRGFTTTYTYDSAGSVTSITRFDDGDGGSGSNVTETIAYGVDEVPTSVTDFNGNTTTYTLDSDGNVLTETDPGGTQEEEWTYNSAGQVLTYTDGNDHVTTYTYDSDGRLSTVTDANDHTSTYTYDSAGNEATVTDADGHTTTYVYDSEDRLVSETDPSGGGTTTYTYDPDNNLLTVTDPQSNTTTYTYNAENEVATETSPTGGVTTYTYDGQGNLTQTVDPDGHTIQYAYDADNRATTETWVNPDDPSSPFDVITTTYDNDGNVSGMFDSAGSEGYAFSYDSRNQLSSLNTTVGGFVPDIVLTYTYDPNGNRTSLSDNQGGTVSYTYNALNQLTSESQSGTGVDPELVDFSYDNAGNMTGLTRYSDTSGTDEVLSTAYTYDNANNLTGISEQLPDSTVVTSYAYTLDPAGLLTEEVHTWDDGSSTDTTDYSYTDNDQLTGVTHSNSSFANESFSYDSNGNRTMTGYTTGTGNQLTSDGTYDYTYDANGNMITKTDIATGDELIYTYDFRNRLVEVDQVVGGDESTLATYGYDLLNRRVEVTEGGNTTFTVYEDNKSTVPLLDFDWFGDVTARYLGGPTPAGVDAVLARDTPSGGVAWYLMDRLGTVGDIINNSGTVINHIDYSAYGQVLAQTDPANGDRFTFAGMQYDATTQLYFDQARYYDAASGRFISQDPESFRAGDANLYRYVSNAPVDLVDPTGEFGILGAAVGAGIGGAIGAIAGGIVGGISGGWSGAATGALSGGLGGIVTGGLVGSGIGVATWGIGVVASFAGAAGGAVTSVSGQLLSGRNPISIGNLGATGFAIIVGAFCGSLGAKIGGAIPAPTTISGKLGPVIQDISVSTPVAILESVINAIAGPAADLVDSVIAALGQ